MEELDEFLSTPDEYFNQTAQYWYFLFESPNKPESKQPFLILIRALRDIYFFTIENHNMPVRCTTNIENVCKTFSFIKSDKLLIIDKLLSMLFSSGEDKYVKVYLQLLNYRNDIEQLPIEKDFISNHYKFDFDNIKNELSKHNDLDEKIKLLRRKMFDFDQALPNMDELEYEYYKRTELVHLVNVELKRLQYELFISKNTKGFTSKNVIKSFEKFLLHKNSKALAQKLKEEFGAGENREIRFMLHVLQNHEPPLIAFTNQSEIVKSLEDFFGKSVGSRQGIFGFKILSAHTPEMKVFKDRLEYILSTIAK